MASKSQKQERLSALDILNESAEPQPEKKGKKGKEIKNSAPKKLRRTKVNLSLGVDTLLLINKMRAKELEEVGKQSPQSRIIDEAIKALAKSRGIE